MPDLSADLQKLDELVTYAKTLMVLVTLVTYKLLVPINEALIFADI